MSGGMQTRASRFDEVKAHVNALKRDWAFGQARKALEPIVDAATRALKDGKSVEWNSKQFPWLVQQLALCTYKDEELIPSKRFKDALTLLEQIGLRTPLALPANVHRDTVPETLALAGAVYKRRWEHEGQLEHLHIALAFYRSAWDFEPALDKGYGGANAAYILDVLASRAVVLARRMGAGTDDPPMREAIRLRRRARALRRVLLARLPILANDWAARHPDDDYRSGYWHKATMGEIHFGLQDYREAANWLERARGVKGPAESADAKWTLQSTFQQLLGIARAQEIPPPNEEADPKTWHPAWQAIYAFLGQSASPALSSYRGRVGLALSGGGFRASFFHIGVLARLADVDALRGVEVLSTVSGGSIVGAHYYLLLREKILASPTGELTRQDYVEIVKKLSNDFHKGVARNIRMRTLSNPVANLRMFVFSSYSRSARLGDLYERELYRLVTHQPGADGGRKMKDLRIAPHGTDPETFKPKFENWKRRAKVPALLLNATSLNSGHNWQFTARWMGEPPGLVDGEVDAVTRYRRLWYDQAPSDSLRNYPLGKAVAASSCVPGLFDPLVLKGLYPGRTVRLVDGGVHDNQGVGGLLNEGCTVILCSDASGQMDDIARPGDSPWSVPLRCSTLLQGRVRVAQYQDLKGRLDSRALQAFMFVHLKKNLEAHPLDWIGCQDPTPTPDQFSATTTYGVDRDLQRKLSEIRTDLDSFTEVEAAALMVSGYRMVEHELSVLQELHQKGGEPGTWSDFDIGAARGKWSFLDPVFLRLMTARQDDPDARRQDLGRQLDVSRSVAFKVWRLVPALTYTALAFGVAVFVAFIWFLVTQWRRPVAYAFDSSVGTIAVMVALLAVTAMFPFLKWLDPTKAMRGYLNKAAIAVLGCVVSNLHLWLFDWVYRSRGRMKRLLELQ